MIDITMTNDTGEVSFLSISPAAATVLSALAHDALMENRDVLHGPVIADVSRVLEGINRLV